jgi:prevent-host-death family protein
LDIVRAGIIKEVAVVAKSISANDLREQFDSTLANVEQTGEAVAITDLGTPKAVLVRFGEYDALVRQVEEGHPRIVRRPDVSDGEPTLQGTRISVRYIVERFSNGSTPSDIVDALPHLSISQVYDALSYYYDHRDEIDQLITESEPNYVLRQNGFFAEPVSDGVAIIRIRSN